MPRLKAPADVIGGVSVGGQYFPLEADGCIEVPETGDYSMLLPGWAPIAEVAAAPVDPQTEPPKAE